MIPKAFRKAARIEPGDEVTFSQEGDAVRVERAVRPDDLMGRLAGHQLVKALEEDRKAERVMAAARIKAAHPLAYGDAFAVATAAAHGATLLTGDPELTGRAVGCRVEDLR